MAVPIVSISLNDEILTELDKLQRRTPRPEHPQHACATHESSARPSCTRALGLARRCSDPSRSAPRARTEPCSMPESPWPDRASSPSRAAQYRRPAYRRATSRRLGGRNSSMDPCRCRLRYPATRSTAPSLRRRRLYRCSA